MLRFNTISIVLCLCAMPILPVDCFEANLFLDDGVDNGIGLIEYVEVAILMTKQYISPRTNTLVIRGKCLYICRQYKSYHATLLNYIMDSLNESLSIQLFLEESEERPWDYNLFVVDSVTALDLLQFEIPYTNHERNYYYLILLIWGSDVLLDNNLLRIFELCLNFNVKNVVVMYKSRWENFIGFYSYQLYNFNKCKEEVMVREVNRYENGRLQFDYLFPTIVNDLFGCTITVSADLLQPFITIDGDLENSTHLEDMERLGGIEGEILKLLADALNFKIHMRFSEELSTIGLHFDSTGSFHDLETKRCKLAIGGLSSTMKHHYIFSRSYAYHTTPYKFVVRNNIFFGPIKQLINPLDKPTWIVLLIIFTISIFLIQTINRMKMTQARNFIFGVQNRSPAFYLIITFLGYSMPNQILPKRNFARFLLMSWVLFALELRTGYLGKMFDSLRLGKRVPVPKTIEELITLDYTLLNPIFTSFYPTNKTKIWLDRSSLLQQVQSSEKLLTGAVILDYWAHYNFQNRTSRSLVPVAETIHSYQCVMYFNKHSFLRDSFDRKLKVFTDFGITAHIARKYVNTNFRALSTESQDVSRITFGNLLGLYYIYGIMCLISVLLFILEMFTKKSKRLKRFMDWLNRE